jgi:hypothetical protein
MGNSNNAPSEQLTSESPLIQPYMQVLHASLSDEEGVGGAGGETPRPRKEQDHDHPQQHSSSYGMVVVAAQG